MKVQKYNLGKTESYKERVAVVVSGDGIASDEILTITTRAGQKTTTVTYAVDYDRDRPYLLAHLRPLGREASDGGPYWVACKDGKWTCNCRGFRPNQDIGCKHCDAVKSMEGILKSEVP
jgi:hypothetical protein